MVVGMLGCASVPNTVATHVPDKSKPAQRKQDIVSEYEKRRDEIQYQAAVSKVQQGDAPGARKTLELLLERSPGHRAANLLAAEIASELVDYNEPIDPDASSESQTSLDAGHLALAESNLKLAIRHYRTAMSAAPHNPHIPRDAALELLQHNQTASAVGLLEHACRQFPQSGTLLRSLATAHYRLGDYESSQVALQQALSLDNTDALAYFLLGAVRKKFGDQPGSTSAFARAQQLDASLATHR